MLCIYSQKKEKNFQASLKTGKNVRCMVVYICVELGVRVLPLYAALDGAIFGDPNGNSRHKVRYFFRETDSSAKHRTNPQ